MNSNQVFNLTFQTGEKLSGPQTLGIDAELFIYPHDSDIASAMIFVSFVLYPQMARESMQMSNEEFFEYAKATFFATGGKVSESKTLETLVKSIEMQRVKKSIPSPGILESGMVSLNNGNLLVIGFEWKESFDNDKAEKMLAEILESLKET